MTKTHEETHAENIDKVLQKMEGNFPVDQYVAETMDLDTGVITLKRISRQDRFLNKEGQEIPDPRPHSPALGRKPETTIRDYVRSLVQSEKLMQDLESQGVETFEEANDFEVGDDYFPDSQYENDLDPPIAELIRAGTASLSAKARATEKSDFEARQSRRQALQAELDSLGDEPPHKPKKSPRKAPKGPAADPEGAANGDLDPTMVVNGGEDAEY